jgi:hypothetical protein
VTKNSILIIIIIFIEQKKLRNDKMLISSYKMSFKYFTNILKLHSFRTRIGKLLKRFAPYLKKYFFINSILLKGIERKQPFLELS